MRAWGTPPGAAARKTISKACRVRPSARLSIPKVLIGGYRKIIRKLRWHSVKTTPLDKRSEGFSNTKSLQQDFIGRKNHGTAFAFLKNWSGFPRRPIFGGCACLKAPQSSGIPKPKSSTQPTATGIPASTVINAPSKRSLVSTPRNMPRTRPRFSFSSLTKSRFPKKGKRTWIPTLSRGFLMVPKIGVSFSKKKSQISGKHQAIYRGFGWLNRLDRLHSRVLLPISINRSQEKRQDLIFCYNKT